MTASCPLYAARLEIDSLSEIASQDPTPAVVTLFLAGDLMLGRGIDQILPHPSAPRLFEPCVHSALEYVALAERASGTLPRAVPFEYVWGDALGELDRVRPAARIVNLETAVTASAECWPDKGIHYRLHPQNVACLAAAHIDCCTLANNHVLDWGRSGLHETLAALRAAHIRTAGAGCDALHAACPAELALQGGSRVLVFAFGMASSGVPRAWRAGQYRSGVNWLEDLSERSVQAVARQVGRHKRPGSLVIASIHWGGNWGYDISAEEREFAHGLIDSAGVDLIHGHSSHHAKGIEVHSGKAILYGCGDFLNDYEGIGGHEAFHGELGLMYFPALDASNGQLVRLSMMPTQIRRFRVNRAPPDGAKWLECVMDRECARLGTRVVRRTDGTLELN